MDDIFNFFADLLEERFLAQVPTTEDSVRYSFFNALLSGRFCRHTDITLEMPHPTIRNARIDGLVTGRSGESSIALEFKYDRGNPSGTNQNRTQRAGSVFSDIFRLARVPESLAGSRYFIYVTDGEMAAYFCNPRNGLNELFNLEKGQLASLPSSLVAASAMSFRERIRDTKMECVLIGVFMRELSGDHSVRAFRIDV